MGRIAEALKKAQQERAARIEAQARDAEETAHSSPFAVADDAIAGEPNAPRPFLLGNSPLLADGIGRQVVSLHDPCSIMAEKYRSLPFVGTLARHVYQPGA